ncbi:g11506 [Coccomyxa viridis]|uniref:G11506 protein n=1 Tax=Coccomyxa viridis TaxID=1274662 RepID=A0ABP1GDT0_9CHLO
MRRLKHKHTRRSIHFYEINYGFRKPYKVILDGNFVHALRETRMGEPAELLAKLLGAPVKCYLTRCSLLELKALGAPFSDTLGAARKAGLHLSCGHDDRALSTAECILDNIGKTNPEHYIVATQERALRQTLGGLPGGASIFTNVNGVHMEPPSEAQRNAIEQAGEASMGVSKHERAAEAMQQLPALQRGPREKSIFRRKGAKGPNPLSVQKKKRPERDAAGSDHADAGSKPKRKRSRKKATDEAGANV